MEGAEYFGESREGNAIDLELRPLAPCLARATVPSLPIVRSTLVILFSLLACCGAFAQQQESKLAQRIRSPNMNLEYDLRKSTFMGTHSVSTKNVAVKEFYYDQKVSPKAFSTGAYAGTKSSWFSNFKFWTKEANTKSKNEIPNATKAAPVKTVAVSDARESQKTMATREFAGERPYLHRGASQDAIDKGEKGQGVPPGIGTDGSLKPMTIDDVRELLNKNK